MPQLDLSALNGAELRRLLDSARERGQAAQSYQILEEMARRREAHGQRRGRRAATAEPRIISVDFGDPLEPRDEVWEEEPAPGPAGDLKLERRAGRPPPKRRWGLPAATFVAGAVIGVAGGAWYADSVQDPPPPPAELATLQAEVAAPPAVANAAPSAPEPAPEPPPEATAPAPSPEPTPETPSVASEPPSEPALPAAEPDPPAVPACGAEPTPADRTICAHPRLQRLQEDLRRAYADALAAHEDRAILRQRQLAWRDARSAVTDPDRLAALYEDRIRKLDSATADARSRR